VRSYEPNTGFLGDCGSFGSSPAHGWALAVQMLPMGRSQLGSSRLPGLMASICGLAVLLAKTGEPHSGQEATARGMAAVDDHLVILYHACIFTAATGTARAEGNAVPLARWQSRQ